MSNKIFSRTSRSTKNYKTENIEVGLGFWHIHNYYLYVQLAWEIHIFHVGDIKADETKDLKINIKIPLKT